jgi:hypothetical protein
MEFSEFQQALINPPEDLADRLILTTERVFYASDILLPLLI